MNKAGLMFSTIAPLFLLMVAAPKIMTIGSAQDPEQHRAQERQERIAKDSPAFLRNHFKIINLLEMPQGSSACYTLESVPDNGHRYKGCINIKDDGLSGNQAGDINKIEDLARGPR